MRNSHPQMKTVITHFTLRFIIHTQPHTIYVLHKHPKPPCQPSNLPTTLSTYSLTSHLVNQHGPPSMHIVQHKNTTTTHDTPSIVLNRTTILHSHAPTQTHRPDQHTRPRVTSLSIFHNPYRHTILPHYTPHGTHSLLTPRAPYINSISQQPIRCLRSAAVLPLSDDTLLASATN
jgi:hypothetical protein